MATRPIMPAVLGLACLALCVSACGGGGWHAGTARSGEALVAVLKTARLSVVEVYAATTGKRIGSVELRSPAFDIASDGDTGMLVTAQAGFAGDGCDDAIGVIDPTAGSIAYVELPWVNPAQVVCAEGRAYVLHGLETADGLALSVVDLVRHEVVATSTVPVSARMLATDGHRVLVPYTGHATSGREVVAVGAIDRSGGWVPDVGILAAGTRFDPVPLLEMGGAEVLAAGMCDGRVGVGPLTGTLVLSDVGTLGPVLALAGDRDRVFVARGDESSGPASTVTVSSFARDAPRVIEVLTSGAFPAAVASSNAVTGVVVGAPLRLLVLGRDGSVRTTIRLAGDPVAVDVALVDCQ